MSDESIGLCPRLEYLALQSPSARFAGLAVWLGHGVGEVFAQREVFLIDSMPLSVCKRARARRCRKVRGKVFCGYCAAKREKVFGWRLHWTCTAEGIPVSFDLLPASAHDLTPLHELAFALPAGTRLVGDKGYIARADAWTLFQQTGVNWKPWAFSNFMRVPILVLP